MKIVFLFIFFISFNYSIIEEKVIVFGVCKDVESKISFSLFIAEKIGRLFKDYRVIVYENNSSDKTPQILAEKARENSKMIVFSERLSKNEIEEISINKYNRGLFKPEFIARCRNKILDIIEGAEYSDFKYVICMDLDFSLEPSYEAIKEVIYSNRSWDAVFANGVDSQGLYWDKYALRDCNIPFGPEILGDKWWKIEGTFLQYEGDWIPVYSAFGGLGIYKRESILGCRYSGIVTSDLETLYKNIIKSNPENKYVKDYIKSIDIKKIVYIDKPNKSNAYSNPSLGICISNSNDKIIWRMNTKTYVYPGVCEHVPFHASMILKGHGNFFINPRLFIYYSFY